MTVTLLAASYIGGVLTIVSPCILPILPFVLARAGQSFLSSTLPMLAGLAGSFALVASLAAVGGGWAVAANEGARLAAVLLLCVFGLSLAWPRLAEVAAHPLVGLGSRLLAATSRQSIAWSPVLSLAVGVATGLLWTPCAGPILGIVLTGAALNGASIGTTILLLAYAAGAATSLAVALLMGKRVTVAARRFLHGSMVARRVAGLAVLASVAAVAFGLDGTVLARASADTTRVLEQAVLDRLHSSVIVGAEVRMAQNGPMIATDAAPPFRSKLPVEGIAAPLDGTGEWINSPPLTMAALRGKVVLVDFWTYSCINCIRTTPFLRAWAEKYHDQGLVVVGVHTPEFAFEKRLANVRRAVSDFGITFPVVLDSDFRTWRAFGNNSWPAFYLVDAQGRIRYRKAGEGSYEQTEQAIQELLREAGSVMASSASVVPQARPIEAAPDWHDICTGETYVGYEHATGFASREGARADVSRDYSVGNLRLNEWGLFGTWTLGAERAILNAPAGGIAFRFSARDLHLVLGRGAAAAPLRFQVTIDGHAPGADHGADADAGGYGTIDTTRLYQLVRQSGSVTARRFEIRFFDAGAEAYSFTFG